MKVLVLGGTGFIGPHVIRRLAAEKHEVSVFTRGRKRPALPESVRQLTGDYQNLAGPADELRRVAPEIVLDMIAMTEQNARAVVETFRGIARRAVAASSQDVYRAWGYVLGIDPGPVDPRLAEDSPLRESRYPYRGRQIPIRTDWDMASYDKILVERVFQAEPRLPATIVRLPMVYGEGDYAHRTFPYLKRMDDRRAIIPLEESAARWRAPLGYVEDVAAAIALAVTNEAAAGRVYNVAEQDVRSTAAFIREIAQAAGWQGRVVELPKGILPGPWDAYRMQQHVLTDSSRIRRELGYRETVPRTESLRRTIEWERAHPPAPAPLIDYAAEDRALAACAPS